MTNDKAMKPTDAQKAVIQGITQIYGVPEKLLIPIADNVLKLLAELQPVNKTDDELTAVLRAIKDARHNFIIFIRSSESSNLLKTKCDDLLIMYDQMAEHIASLLPRLEADKELLEALKGCVNYVGTIAEKSEPAMNAFIKAHKAIRNAEKETK